MLGGPWSGEGALQRLRYSLATSPSGRARPLGEVAREYLSLWSAPSPLQGPPNTAVISSALSGAVYYGALKPRPLPWPSPTTSQSKASGAPPRQSQSAGGPPRLSPPPPPIPAAHVQGTKPVGLRPAVSSVPKTPSNCRPKGEGDAAGGERHPYLNLFSSLAGQP